MLSHLLRNSQTGIYFPSYTFQLNDHVWRHLQMNHIVVYILCLLIFHKTYLDDFHWIKTFWGFLGYKTTHTPILNLKVGVLLTS